MNWRDIFRKNKPGVIVDDPHQYIKSMVLYNTKNNFVILIEFYYDLLPDAIELINANAYVKLHQLRVMYSCLETEKVQEDLETKITAIIVQKRYYLLVSGNDTSYNNLFETIPMSNTFAAQIANELYQFRSSSYYPELIENKVLDKQKFKHQGIAPEYDERVEIDSYNQIDDIDKIMAKIPSSFSLYDVLKVITLTLYEDVNWVLFEFIDFYKSPSAKLVRDKEHREKMFTPFISSIAKVFGDKVSLEEIVHNVTQPIYLRHETDVEFDYGPDKSIDEMDKLFAQEYDRYNPFEQDQNVIYKDIDEQVSDTVESS